MKPVRLALLALSVALAGAAQAAPARHPAHPAAIDWTRTVVPTADGGVRVGNPQAKVRLVEYFSTTCPHCAAFAKEAYPPLFAQYVRTGQVSFEVRAALRDAVDLVAATSVRCASPAHYFATLEDVMGAQGDWEPKTIDWVNAHQADLQGAKKDAGVRALVTGVGLQAIVAKHGVTPAALGACLVSKPIAQALERSTNDAWNVKKIDGTPNFYLDDAALKDVYVWSQLQPLIDKAIKA